MVDFNDMAVFVRVVEEGSFIGAGRRLGVPKSTVSRRVAELEARLGVRLLHRTTRALHPTEAGAAYFERCAPLVALAEQAERAVMQDQLAPTGLLRITAPSLLGERILAPIVFAFLARYPAARGGHLLRRREPRVGGRARRAGVSHRVARPPVHRWASPDC